MLGENGGRIHELVASLHDTKVLPTIQGDLVIKNGERFTTYRTAPTYTVGHLPWWMWLDWFLSRHPLVMYILGVIGAAMMGTGAWLWLRARAHRRVKAQEKLDEETAREEKH